MINNQKYVILSLELHLFFSRIMKEHSLFLEAGTVGIDECKIQSIILPLLADHVLRKANHYVRILKSYTNMC